MADLRCPDCGDTITPVLEYVRSSYSEHRDHTGYECDEYRCGAEWDRHGKQTVPSKKSTDGGPSEAPASKQNAD